MVEKAEEFMRNANNKLRKTNQKKRTIYSSLFLYNIMR